MRLWLGPEMEGPNSNRLTLFVEGHYLTESDVDLVLEKFKELNPEAVYLGAGRRNTIFLGEELARIVYAAKERGMVVTIETSHLRNVENHMALINAQDILVVYRTEVDLTNEEFRQLQANMLVKFDNHSEVYLGGFRSDYLTDVTTVRDGRYAVDRIIKD